VPIYDYVCESCGRVIEVIHGLHADGPAECPDCGGAMSKVFAAPTIHFKGSGWAKKDRRSTSGTVKPKETKQGEASGSSGSGPAADSGGSSAPALAPDPGGSSGGSGGTSGDSGRASVDSGRASSADKE
jgi:putative FmdB family regulatory protein